MSTQPLTGRRVAIMGIRGLPARYGGFETFAERLAQALVAAGAAVTVYCEAGDGQAGPPSYQGIALQHVRARASGGLASIAFDVRCLWHARKGFDIVYMLGYGSSFACFVPRLWGTRVWINMDGVEWARSKWSWPARTWLRLMEAMAMWTPGLVIADAERIRQHLERRHHRMPACRVIPYGADIPHPPPPPDPLARWKLAPDGFYLVVCRIEPENHVADIVAGYLRSATARPLVVVGDTGISAYATALGREGGDAVRFIGTVYDRDELAALRCHCRAYFHGHSVGGTNPSLLEAMGCGNAVLAHDNPFNREVAAAAALYFGGADDIPRLVAKMESDSERLAAMRQAALARVREAYSWDRVNALYIELVASDK